jgi:hypothetical protein
VSVDGYVGDTAERTVVTQPEHVHLARPREDVTGFDLADVAIRRYDLDAEIAHSHALPPEVSVGS